MTAVSDDFNRADSDSLGSNWTEANGDCDIVSNMLVPITGSFTNNLAVYTGQALNADQYVKIQFGNAQTQYPIVIFRYTDASSPFYVLFIDGSNGTWDWYRFANATDSGTSIQSGVTIGTLLSGSDNASFTIEGTGTSTVIRAWKNTTADAPGSASLWDGSGPAGSATNDPASPVNSGSYVGCGAQQGTASWNAINNFWAGDIGGASVIKPAMHLQRLMRA
jgi:hypothetical protein